MRRRKKRRKQGRYGGGKRGERENRVHTGPWGQYGSGVGSGRRVLKRSALLESPLEPEDEMAGHLSLSLTSRSTTEGSVGSG